MCLSTSLRAFSAGHSGALWGWGRGRRPMGSITPSIPYSHPYYYYNSCLYVGKIFLFSLTLINSFLQMPPLWLKKRQGKESVCPPYHLYTRHRISLGTEWNSAMYQMITMQLENSAPIPPSIPLINKENSGPGEIWESFWHLPNFCIIDKSSEKQEKA